MKSKLLKSLSVFLAVIVLFSVVPVGAITASAAGNVTLEQLQTKFPNGKYWNGGNADSYTSTPCTHHGSGCTYSGSCGCNSFKSLSIQCMGYAEKLGYDFTGYNPRNNANGWYTYTSSSALDSLKPGDIIRFDNGSYNHSIFVTAVSGDTITYTDCNSDGHCIIRWGKTTSKSTLKSKLIHVRSAPYAILDTCNCTTSYAGNYTCITSSNYTLTIRSGHGTSYSAIGSIPSGATVTVTKANGSWAHVTYNGVSGYASMEYLEKIHTHTYSEYYEAAHPHKIYKKCSCGDWYYTDQKQYISSCTNCNMPGKPEFINLSKQYIEQETVVFAWDNVVNATHYCFYLYALNEQDEWEVYEHTFYVTSEFTMKLPVGQYRCILQAYNSNYWREDGSDWLYTESDFEYFSVIKSSYTISYNANGGTGAPSSQIKTHGTTLTLSSTKPIRDGYTFLGWSTNSTATSATYLSGGSFTIEDDTTLYAVWEKITLTKLEIKSKPTKTSYYVGDSLNTSGLTLKATYSDGSTATVSSGYTTSGFSSSSAGTKTVTVTYEGKTTTFTVTVNTPTISLSSSSETLDIGDTVTLTATTTPSGQTVTWTSSNTSVATVSNGTITAKSAGTATVTAKFTYNGKEYSKTCAINVNKATVTTISVLSNPTKTTYYIGDAIDTTGLKIRATYSDGTTGTYANYFTVSGFESDTAGTKTVTVSYGGKTTTFTVTVNTPTISLSSSSETLDIGDAVTLTATTTPSGQTVTWTSSNTSVATVSNGTVTAKSNGTATITAKFIYNGTAYSKTCTVKVDKATVTSISVLTMPTKTIYYIGDAIDTTGLKIRATYSDGTTGTYANYFTVSGFESDTVGTKTVTVTYGGKTTTFTVEVKQKVIDNAFTVVIGSDKETVSVGGTVKVTLTPKDFAFSEGLCSFDCPELYFDSSALKFVGATVNNSNFDVGANERENGCLSIMVTDNSLTGASFGDGECYVTLEFKALAECVTTISLQSDAVISGTVANDELLPCIGVAGSDLKIEITSVVKGDVTGDGLINSTDFMWIRRYYLGLFPLTDAQKEAADVNNDGLINSTDFTRIRRHYLGLFDLFA